MRVFEHEEFRFGVMMKGYPEAHCTSGEFPYAAIWVMGTIPAMARGTVTGGWDWRHRRRWLAAKGEPRNGSCSQ
jgi:cytochrome b subunit of formate dehydrogenase